MDMDIFIGLLLMSLYFIVPGSLFLMFLPVSYIIGARSLGLDIPVSEKWRKLSIYWYALTETAPMSILLAIFYVGNYYLIEWVIIGGLVWLVGILVSMRRLRPNRKQYFLWTMYIFAGLALWFWLFRLMIYLLGDIF